ncbi:MAG: uroporphyrinogen-III synthase [Acidiferrobacter sp.]
MTELSGLKVLVTRPEGQAQGLMDKLTAQGATPLHFAAIEILEPRDTAGLKALIGRLPTFDWAIFISPNAVARALNLLQGLGREWPSSVRIAGIGRGSARELKRFGLTDVLVPGGRFDSESLLALEPMQDVSGKTFIVFRGEGGRELLGDTLETRGAHVVYAECYRRGAPTADVSALLRIWARQGLDVVTLTSIEGLHHLYDVLGQVGRRWLAKTALVVVGPRVKEACLALGLEGPIIVADGACDEDIIHALLVWHLEKNPL